MTDKKKIIKLVLISTLTALPFLYFGGEVALVAFAVAMAISIGRPGISTRWNVVFFSLFSLSLAFGLKLYALPIIFVAYFMVSLKESVPSRSTFTNNVDDLEEEVGPRAAYYSTIMDTDEATSMMKY